MYAEKKIDRHHTISFTELLKRIITNANTEYYSERLICKVNNLRLMIIYLFISGVNVENLRAKRLYLTATQVYPLVPENIFSEYRKTTKVNLKWKLFFSTIMELKLNYFQFINL